MLFRWKMVPRTVAQQLEDSKVMSYEKDVPTFYSATSPLQESDHDVIVAFITY